MELKKLLKGKSICLSEIQGSFDIIAFNFRKGVTIDKPSVDILIKQGDRTIECYSFSGVVIDQLYNLSQNAEATHKGAFTFAERGVEGFIGNEGITCQLIKKDGYVKLV